MNFKSYNNRLIILIMLLFLGACGTDDDNLSPIEDVTTESFSNLTVEQFSLIETPFEALLEDNIDFKRIDE